MCASRSTPSSCAPSITSSRFTPLANALSFIFFRTDFASTSWTLFVGFTSAVAVIRPESSSTANSVRAMRVSRGDAAVRRVAKNGLQNVLWPAALAQKSHAPRRMLLGRRVRGVRISLVVEIVDQPGQPPPLRILAEVLGVGAHRGFDAEHVLSERLAGGVLVHQSERVRAGRGGEFGGRHGVKYTTGAASNGSARRLRQLGRQLASRRQ